jgi:putative membrane-bound dehydrogenase-like protein
VVEDPVAFAIDERGTLFVAESFRQEAGIEDNRSSAFWLNDDLQLQSVEDRLRMYEKWSAKRAGGMAYYRREEDRVVRLVDTDGDGFPDAKTNFSGPMNEPLDGTGAGILCLDGSVYYTCIPHLWRFEDPQGTGTATVREKMFSGFGIRTALRGHDMHGLVQGPDGRIYWSIGDRGYRVRTREGTELARPFTGAVFRCEPDGSRLEVFAHSLRNPQELAFNQWGDLFTGDNNSDSGDRARIVYVMEGGETGWDMNYQTLEGQNQRGPWNQERTWWTWDANDPIRPAWTLPPIAHLTDGPSGIVFYPGVGLPARYDHHFFLCDFLGGDEYSRIVSFAVEPEGAGYRVVDAHPFVTEVLPTDVDFGYDGHMYISDWSNGWTSDHTGQIYRVWHPESLEDSRVHEIGVLFREGFAGQSDDMLLALLSHPDQRVRQRAHLELARRPATLPALARIAADADRPEPDRLHALWAIGVMARRAADAGQPAPAAGATPASGAARLPAAEAAILARLSDPAVEIRRLAARLAGDARLEAAGPALIELLTDEDLRVRAQAALAIGRIGHADAFANLAAAIWENDNQDPFLRHALVMGMVGLNLPDKVRELAADQFPQNRLAAVLVMRRAADPQLARLLHDPDLRVATEAARAINDLPIPEAEPALAALAARFAPTDEAVAAEQRAPAATWTRELWADHKGFAAADLVSSPVFATPPTRTATAEEAVGFTKAGNDFVQRVRGVFTAPAAGRYVFLLASDDDGVLFVEPESAAEGHGGAAPGGARAAEGAAPGDDGARRVAARVTNYVNPGAWDSQPGQRSAPVELAAGQRVAIEARARQMGGGCHLAVGVVHPDGRVEAPIGAFTGDASTLPLLRRIVAANLRSGTPANAAALAELARNPALPPLARADAAGALAEFMNPSPRNRVNGHWQALDPGTRDLAAYRAVLAQRLPTLVANGSADVRAIARETAAAQGVALDSAAAFATAMDPGKPVEERLACLTQLVQDRDTRALEAVEAALASDDARLRAQGRALLARLDPARGVPALVAALATGTVPEQQAAIRALAKSAAPEARTALAAQTEALVAGTLPPALQVDVLEAAEAEPALQPRVAAWRAALPSGAPDAAWLICLEGGDPDAGRKIVNFHSAAACLRCHTVEGTGGHAAPSLAGVASRYDRRGLLDSLIAPNAVVAEGFGPVSAMPAMGTLLTPREIRDVVAYLATLK